MKKLLQTIFLSLLLFVSGCCINRQRQVWLTELKDAHEADRNSVVRIYLDKRGNFYPDNIYIPYKSFFKYKNTTSTYVLKETTGNLKSYFTSSPEISNQLATAYHLQPDYDSSSKIFTEAEQLILANTTKKINDLLLLNSSKILIVMIHGFNDPNPTGDYQRMRDYIKNYKHLNDAVYLEVYWDGLTANQGNPGFARIWSFAQLNSAYEANALRSILNAVNADTRIRIITHSLGASIGTGALFNTYRKWGNPISQDYYKQMMRVHAPEQNDIRIGMIAPAIPGVNTFIDFNHRDSIHTITADKNNISHVVVGFKETDEALLKGFFQKKKYLSKIFGATTLGCNAVTDDKCELDRVEDTMKSLGYENPGSIVDTVNFKFTNASLPDLGFLNEQHGLYYYMENEQSLKLFLDYLFD